jgi:anti-anti-sigma factor
MDSTGDGHTSAIMPSRHLHAVRAHGDVFACNVRRLGVTAVIELQGELDLAARKTLDDALEAALHPGPVVTVVADLDAVTSVDASTVSWLLHADALVRLAGARFVTVLGSGRAGQVLGLTGVERRLDVVGGSRAR